jgi:putative two-component system response regulator
MEAESAGTVLVIDDQPLTLEAMREALIPLGFEVWQAVDGEMGLMLAKERQPDVILLDVMMPGIDGFEVCRRLKADDETRLLPVLFLTGLDSRQARLRGLAVGATDFLFKPFDLVELEVRVRNLVEFRRLTQDLDDAEKMIFSIARVIEARHEGTGEHCDRLSREAARLGQHLGLDNESIKTLRRAGYLHDIGKIGVPDQVLLKPGKFDEHELKIMRSHVAIRHHHERRDGSGYPDKLTGDDIPLLARVFQVLDIYDALTNDRPYRKALSPAEALNLLREETMRGWWDVAIVDAFAALLESEATGAATTAAVK